MNHLNEPDVPPLREIGPDLLKVAAWERVFTLALPFAWAGAYFAFAILGWWPAAVFSLVALSFIVVWRVPVRGLMYVGSEMEPSR